jgi:hypothetical protein
MFSFRQMMYIDAIALRQRIMHGSGLLGVVVSASFDSLSVLNLVGGFHNY